MTGFKVGLVALMLVGLVVNVVVGNMVMAGVLGGLISADALLRRK